VERWSVPRVIFTFPRPLNETEHAHFHKVLGNAHEGVTVDYWNSDKLTAVMLADEPGNRIARYLFQEIDPLAVLDRAYRAGGPLWEGGHVLERQAAIQGFLSGQDPHFDWILRTRARGAPDAPPTPGAVLRLEFGDDEHVIVAEAVARHASSLTGYGPEVRVGGANIEDVY
jgi:hypothetical protein